ncbi:MAG: 4'-phosphopantetheinyl transferase superfamily protein [Planctomycetaceae bacterium]
MATIAICSRNERRQSVRPAITIAEQIVPWSLSISHSERLVAALLITRPGITVGVDLASRQPFRPGFLRTWFFPSEQEWAQSGPSDIAAIIWAAKEAVYKAFNEGESFAPHMVEILERSWEGEAPAEPCLAGALSTAGLKSVVDCPPTLTLPREGGGGSTTDVALTFEAPESVGALDGSSGRLSARYRGRDVSSECQIEYRTLDNDVVVIARRCEASHCIEFSREPDGARDLVGENR